MSVNFTEEYILEVKYVDPDKDRPPVNERAKQELGFGLIEEYDWSDK